MTRKSSDPSGTNPGDGVAEDANAKGWNFEQLLAQIEQEYKSSGIKDFWPREKDAIRSALGSVAATLPQARYSPIRVLGVGGSGVVIRLKDSLFSRVDNALKFPRPVAGKVELVAELLGREIKYLAQLRHPGIVKILYYRYAKNIPGYGTLPFYLMEAVDGVSSGKFARKQLSKQQQFVDLVRNTAATL